jgi:hypothetical protein
MILRDHNGDPVVFTVEVVHDPYFPNDKQLVSGHLELLGAPKEERWHAGPFIGTRFSEDPIGVVFVPEQDQEVKGS